MSLRRQLLLLALVLLILPVAAWQVAVRIEEFLREARQEALVTSARSLARAFVTDQVVAELVLAEGAIYVHAIGFAPRTDGYDDDWQLWTPWEQWFESSQGALRMSALLAADPRRLYLLVRVSDPSPKRAASSPAGFQAGDHLLLKLVDERGLHSYRIVPSVPGALEIVPVSPGASMSPPPLEGAWRERDDARGYLVEFSLPRALIGSRLALAAVDTGDGLGPTRLAGTISDARVEPRRLVFRSPAWSARLAELTPPGTRAWLVAAGGWVLAAGGRLEPAAPSEPRGWHRLLYRLLARRTLEPAPVREPGADLRLTGGELDAALGGRLAVRWRTASGAAVLGSVAVPVTYGARAVGALVLEQPADALLLATNRTAGQVLGLTVGVVVLVVTSLLAYASLLSLRVRRLRNAAEAAIDGDAPASVNLPGAATKDEIGDLARSFSRLLTELKSYNDYLKTLAGKLSHELNTPLAVVRSSLDNLAHERLDGEAERYATRAREGAERLQRILRAMSEAQRLEQAIESSDRVAFDLVEVVTGCCQGYRHIDPDHGWTLEHAAAALPLNGSPELVAQMLDKLIDNARSFAPAGSAIVIATGPARGGARLTVANDGPLLPDHLRHRLFESLVSMRERGGDQVHLGLGLHIVRLIARAHRGSVTAANRADGSGVEFSVVLRGMQQTITGSPISSR